MSESKSYESIVVPEETQAMLRSKYFEHWHGEVKGLLPTLPDNIAYKFDNHLLIEGEGVGGFASAVDTITLAFDPDYNDKEEQLKKFKGTFFHECFHLVQGYTGDKVDMDVAVLPAIHSAIYEGAATVFEREKTGSNPFWGQYPDKDTTLSWISQIKDLSADYDWKKWKWFNPDNNEPNIMYRAGTFIVDDYLSKHPDSTIEDLATMPPEDILVGSGL